MNSSNKSRNLFVFVLLTVLSVGAAIFFIQVFRSINAQQDIQYPESAVVFGIVNLSRGGTLYHDFHNPPFAVISYPPVFYVISAAVSKLFAHSVHSVYVCARVVAFGATVLTAVFATIFTGRAKCGRAAQFATAILFFGSSLLLPWGFIARVDSLMLLFTITGLYLFIRFRESNWQYLAVIAFVLAIFTKQSALAAPGAVVVMLAFQRKWKQGLIFVTALVSLSVACFLVGNYLTDGLLALNVIGGIAAPIRWQSVFEVFRNSFSGLFLPLILSILALAAFLRRRSTDSLAEAEPVVIFGLYLIGSVALAALSSTKLGSDRNYYLDSLLASSVLGGLGLEWLANQSQRAWSGAILALFVVVFVGLPDFSQRYQVLTSDYFVSQDNSATVESLRPLSGDILTQDSNIALRLDKPVFVTDSYHLSVMISTGRWKPDPLISLIEQKHFRAVVLPFDLGAMQRPDWASYQGLAIWDQRILNVINDNYRLAETAWRFLYILWTLRTADVIFNEFLSGRFFPTFPDFCDRIRLLIPDNLKKGAQFRLLSVCFIVSAPTPSNTSCTRIRLVIGGSMKRIFVPVVLAAFFSLGLITASAQTPIRTATPGGTKPQPTAAKTLRVNAMSSSSVDGPPTTDDDGVHFSFTGGVIDRGNPLFDGTISISETVTAPGPAATVNAGGRVSGVITVGSGKGDRQATIVLEFKGLMKGNQIAGEWKVSGATGIADGLKGAGKFTARRVREGLFLNLTGVIGKPK